MFVGFARLTVSIPNAGSLKDKRQVLQKVLERVKARFNVSAAEVGDNDLWQRAVLGVAAVGNDSVHVREVLDKVIHFVEEMYVAPVLSRQSEVVPVGDFYGADDGTSFGTAAHGATRSMAEAEGLDQGPEAGAPGRRPARLRHRRR